MKPPLRLTFLNRARFLQERVEHKYHPDAPSLVRTSSFMIAGKLTVRGMGGSYEEGMTSFFWYEARHECAGRYRIFEHIMRVPEEERRTKEVRTPAEDCKGLYNLGEAVGKLAELEQTFRADREMHLVYDASKTPFHYSRWARTGDRQKKAVCMNGNKKAPA